MTLIRRTQGPPPPPGLPGTETLSHPTLPHQPPLLYRIDLIIPQNHLLNHIIDAVAIIRRLWPRHPPRLATGTIPPRMCSAGGVEKVDICLLRAQSNRGTDLVSFVARKVTQTKNARTQFASVASHQDTGRSTVSLVPNHYLQ